MMAEVMLGRHGRKSPINAMRDIVTESGIDRRWSYIGWLGVVAAILILSFYAVIAGWALSYILEMGSGVLKGADGETAAAAFTQLLNDPAKLILWQTIFLTLCVAVVMGGVKKGLGVAVETLMPILFFILLGLLVFSFFKGNFSSAANFLFSFNLDQLTSRSILEAMGQAFFTLSIGMGAIMAYGAYMPQTASIGKTILVVAFFDSAVAIISGLVFSQLYLPLKVLNPALAQV